MLLNVSASLFPTCACAAAVVIMIRTRDWKFGIRACEICGQKGEHLPGCVGRR